MMESRLMEAWTVGTQDVENGLSGVKTASMMFLDRMKGKTGTIWYSRTAPIVAYPRLEVTQDGNQHTFAF